MCMQLMYLQPCLTPGCRSKVQAGGRFVPCCEAAAKGIYNECRIGFREVRIDFTTTELFYCGGCRAVHESWMLELREAMCRV